MLSVPVFNMDGQPAGEVEIDPAVLGKEVRYSLLKQAIVAYLDHQRQHSARTRGRAQVVGSTRKLYRQKGTGRARAGAARTPVRRGGGRAFAKRIPQSFKSFPRKMRQLARRNAVLAKIESGDCVVIDDLVCEAPKTKTMATLLSAIKADRGCVVATTEPDKNLHLSCRNIPKTETRVVSDLNAYEVLRRDKLVFTRGAFEHLAKGPTEGDAA